MKKGREFLRSRAFRIGVMCCLAVFLMCSMAFAAEGDTTSSVVTSAFQTGFQQIASDALNMIGIIVPIALSVAGVIFLARKAMGWFKSLTK